MKILKLFAVFLLMGLLNLGYISPVSAQDQEPDKKTEQQEPAVEKLKSELNLSDGQVAQIKEIQKDTKAKLEDLHAQKSTVTAEAFFDRKKAIRKEARERLEKVLNRDQMDKLRSMRAERRGKIKEMRKQNRNNKPDGMNHKRQVK